MGGVGRARLLLRERGEEARDRRLGHRREQPGHEERDQQRRSEEEINRLAKYDSLTNLPNRMLMRRTLDETLQKKGDAAGGGCALFLASDLSRFVTGTTLCVDGGWSAMGWIYKEDTASPAQ